jgi:hypothetical protein
MSRGGKREQWVGTERGLYKPVSPSPPLEPYVPLLWHTARDSRAVRSFPFPPLSGVHRGQLRAFEMGNWYLTLLSLWPFPLYRAFLCSEYYGPSDCLQGPWSIPGSFVPSSRSPSHPLQALPCSQGWTHRQCCRWRFAPHLYRTSRLPRGDEVDRSLVPTLPGIRRPVGVPRPTLRQGVALWLPPQGGCGRGRVPRRGTSASCALTMASRSQAWPLGDLLSPHQYLAGACCSPR